LPDRAKNARAVVVVVVAEVATVVAAVVVVAGAAAVVVAVTGTDRIFTFNRLVFRACQVNRIASSAVYSVLAQSFIPLSPYERREY
jgi:hypothetical protein